jgi:hypothetical protein
MAFKPKYKKSVSKPAVTNITVDEIDMDSILDPENIYNKLMSLREYQEAGEVVNPNNPVQLKEVTIKEKRLPKPITSYGDYIASKHQDDNLGEAMFLAPLDAILSFPQAYATKLATGKYQTPSEAWGYKQPKGFAQHAGNFVMDAVADPLNLAGVGLLDDGFKLGIKTTNVVKNGFPNPLGIIDKLIPKPLNPQALVGMDGSWMDLSPLTYLKGYGDELYDNASRHPNFIGFRKFGNSLDDVIESQSLRPRGNGMGSSQIRHEGNWAEPGKVNHKYNGVFAAKMNPQIEGSNILLEKIHKRNGILGTTKDGDVAIPLTDPGLSFNRRLPFSNRYIPIDKQKLINKEFQLATQLPHVQSLAEKYALWAGLFAGSGYLWNGEEGAKENLNTLHNYTINPIIDQMRKQLYNNNLQKRKTGGTIPQYQLAGQYKLNLTPNTRAGFTPASTFVNVPEAKLNKQVLDVEQTAKQARYQSTVSTARPTTPFSQYNRQRLNQQFANTHPYAVIDEEGNLSPAYAQRTMEGVPLANTQAETINKGLNTLGERMDQALLATGAYDVGRVGVKGLGVIGDEIITNIPLRSAYHKIDPYVSNIGRQLKKIETDGIKKGLSDYSIKNQQMQLIGTTSLQRKGYFPGVSEIMSEYFVPYSYDNPTKRLLEIPKKILKKDTNTKRLTSIENVIKNEGETTLSRPRYDAWRLYSGLPQKHGTFRIAETFPKNHPSYTNDQLKNIELFSLNDEKTLLRDLPNEFDYFRYHIDDDALLKHTDFLKKQLDNITNLKKEGIMFSPSDFNTTNVMGGHNIRFFDNKMEYNDIWDLNLKGIPVEKYYGKPFMSHGQLDYSFEPAENMLKHLLIKAEKAPIQYNSLKNKKYTFDDLINQINLKNNNYNYLKNISDKSATKLKLGGNINKYQRGGQTNPPIYVSNVNDPRLKSYSDSLNAYIQSINLKNKVEKTKQFPDPETEGRTTISITGESRSMLPKTALEKTLRHPDGDNFNNFTRYNEGTGKRMKPIDILKYPSDKWYSLEAGILPIFAKPVQPIIYKNNIPVPPQPPIPPSSTHPVNRMKRLPNIGNGNKINIKGTPINYSPNVFIQPQTNTPTQRSISGGWEIINGEWKRVPYNVYQDGGYTEWKNKNFLQESSDYNLKRAFELGYTPDKYGHLPSVDFETGEWLKSNKHHTRGMELMEYMLNPSVANNFNLIRNEKGNMQYVPKQAQGGEMIKRADGSYSRRGLWDNIRANRGSGKKPTKQMLQQERKIKNK